VKKTIVCYSYYKDADDDDSDWSTISQNLNISTSISTPGAQPAFIKWTGLTLAMTTSWWQHHKHCHSYYHYYYYHYLTVVHYSVQAVTYPILQGTEITGVSGKYITICNYRPVFLPQQKW